ncbi:MAG: manganese efflux pump [Lachnospiraceae bacterium]|nr:manganese efflux pump [Lachnospiraceae bacterium]
MGLTDLFLIAVGLSMDAFAVAICKGLSVKKVTIKHGLIVGAYFGGFQAGMPLLGYLLGSSFAKYIEAFDHWVAFVLLWIIGINMIRESREQGEEVNASFGLKAMLPMAVATSIDALAVGISFAFMRVQIGWAVLFIGVITFTLSAIGVKLGNHFGAKYKSKAELFGGIVLILLGTKILLEHLGIL